MIRVEFSNLTFDLEADIERGPNVKFIPLNRYRLSPVLSPSSGMLSDHLCARNTLMLYG
ncbi:hypothetical protein CHELA40_50528 [Chelatococcus asaccharovorans]|nr:hypothetical protein CHELA17_20497 [Chelatococcus asaccharovorans]CAH1693192.1 hypothetical protein CHELA40_50528 [Chelatococcus asaccharovorans]